MNYFVVRFDARCHIWVLDNSSGALENGGCFYGVGVTFSTTHRLLDLLLAQPLLRGHEIPAEERKDRRRAKDDAGKVERRGRHGEVERGDHDLFYAPWSAFKPARKKKTGA
jgi:hypothetical protein